MSDIDPLIRRELNWMALGTLEHSDISELVFAKVRRRRIKKALIIGGAILSAVVISFASVGFYIQQHDRAQRLASMNTGATGSHDKSAVMPEDISGIISDYPLTWEQGVGDTGAISKAAGLGDTLAGLTAVGLKVSWQSCDSGQCPTTWTLALKNNTQDIVSTNPALMIFTDHNPLISTSRPTTVTPGATALLVYTFPEVRSQLSVAKQATWQWNWYLVSAK